MDRVDIWTDSNWRPKCRAWYPYFCLLVAIWIDNIGVVIALVTGSSNSYYFSKALHWIHSHFTITQQESNLGWEAATTAGNRTQDLLIKVTGSDAFTNYATSPGTHRLLPLTFACHMYVLSGQQFSAFRIICLYNDNGYVYCPRYPRRFSKLYTTFPLTSAPF